MQKISKIELIRLHNKVLELSYIIARMIDRYAQTEADNKRGK